MLAQSEAMRQAGTHTVSMCLLGSHIPHNAGVLVIQAVTLCPVCAGCVEALAEERAVLFALWLVHRPPSPTVQMLALRLLHALSGTAAAAWAAAAHAGYLYLLCVLLQTQGTVNERVTPSLQSHHLLLRA